jgi:hypothetical protein
VATSCTIDDNTVVIFVQMLFADATSGKLARRSLKLWLLNADNRLFGVYKLSLGLFVLIIILGSTSCSGHSREFKIVLASWIKWWQTLKLIELNVDRVRIARLRA